MSEKYIKTAFSLKMKTYKNLKKNCPDLVPLSRYMNSILEKEFSKKGGRKKSS